MTASVLSGARLAAGGTLEIGSSPIGGGGGGGGGEVPVQPATQGEVLTTTQNGGTSSTPGVVATGATPGGPAEGVQGAQASGGFAPVLGEGSPSGSPSSGGGGEQGVLGTSASGGGTEAGLQGSLPFTGFGAAFVAALGAGLAAAGAAVRRTASRRS